MMERTQKLFELIEDYLDGTMKEVERAEFELQIKENSDLELEVQKHQVLSEVLQDEEALAFRKKVATIAADFKQEKSQLIDKRHTGNTSGRSWKVAAAILVLLGLGVVFWWQLNSEKSIYDYYYEPYAIEETMRGADDDQLGAVVKDYAKGKYREVIPQLIDLIEQYPEKTVLRVYLANSYLQMNQELLAIDILKAIKLGNVKYEAGRWYLALSYIKAANITQATTVLEELIAYDGIYKNRAEKLLIEIKR